MEEVARGAEGGGLLMAAPAIWPRVQPDDPNRALTAIIIAVCRDCRRALAESPTGRLPTAVSGYPAAPAVQSERGTHAPYHLRHMPIVLTPAGKREEANMAKKCDAANIFWAIEAARDRGVL